MRIAIVGTGVSGCLVARLLATAHDVVVYEQADYAGGHAQTLPVEQAGQTYFVDTGFMVFNERTYPHFCRMLEHLGVAARDSDMSFSVCCARTGLEYQGSSLRGLFSQRRNLLRPGFHRMLWDILRFNRMATELVRRDALDDDMTVAELLDRCGVGASFVDQYFVPMTAAIWSAAPDHIRAFPARFLIGFCHNHGLLQLRDRPRWRTVRGGSRCYVSTLLEPLRDRVRLNCAVRRVRRLARQIAVHDERGGIELYDEVVFACHADQVLAILAEPTAEEGRLLSAFPYQANVAVLHTDEAQLPRRRRAWASWNYRIPADPQQTVSVTYDLSRLQGHATRSPLLLTLNPTEPIDAAHVLRTLHYEHPAYGPASVAAQRQWAATSGRDRVHYCGAYWGYGFHEDGVNSALAVAGTFLPPEDASRRVPRSASPRVAAPRRADLLGYLSRPLRPAAALSAEPFCRGRAG